MRHSRVLAACGAAALVATSLAGTAGANSASAKVVHTGKKDSYVVLTQSAAGADSVAARLRAQGAEVTSVNKAIGMVVVKSDDANFRQNAGAVSGVDGVAADRVIGHTPKQNANVEQEHLQAARGGHDVTGKAPTSRHAPTNRQTRADPLDSNLWGMRMIKADQAHTRTLGSKKVMVGIMDTGVQADHPDLHANFDYRLSRNFTTDNENGVPDGPCEVPSCVDPVGVDDNGHGTHVTGTIAASLDGFGLSGVAPKVKVVEVRAGQDSGYFFTAPTVNALTYSGDAGLDAVNMSFYVDPWLYNCAGGAPEDTPAQAADQATIIKAVTRALDYAHRKGVTLVAATGNNHEDLANPRHDISSPDFGAPIHERTISNASCYDLPVEGPHVLGINALGPSERKSDFSNYTTEPTSGEVEMSAPGGWFRDGFGTDTYSTVQNEILSTAPVKVLQAGTTPLVDQNGNITPAGEAAGVMKQCQRHPARGTTACGYYQWLQGTSMATPHATGVAALAISAHGRQTRSGFGMAPDAVRAVMMRSATDHACPAGGTQSYVDVGRSDEFTAECVGTVDRNGFYGDGIVNAWGVVR